MTVKVISAGLAGSEAAWQLAQRGVEVERVYAIVLNSVGVSHNLNVFEAFYCAVKLNLHLFGK